MAQLKIRIEDELLERFDQIAAGLGGRAVLLRLLILAEVARGGPGVAMESRPARVTVQLTPAEDAYLAREARAMGLPRSTWAAALIRRHLLGAPHFDRSSELALFAIHGELRRLRGALGELAAASTDGRAAPARPDSLELDDLRASIHRQMCALRQAFKGNLDYWDILR